MLDKKNFYINGKWISPFEPKNYKVINPSNEEPCAEISIGGKKDIEKAVKAAKKAFETWAYTKKEERLARVSPSTPRREGCRIRPPRKRPTYRCERLGHASVVLVRLQRAGLLLGEVLLGANLRRAREAGGERKSGERRADGEARRTNA